MRNSTGHAIRKCMGRVTKIIFREDIALCLTPELVLLAPNVCDWRDRLEDESFRMGATLRPFEQMDKPKETDSDLHS